MNCLFIHVPKQYGDSLSILKMPLGLHALCWQVKKAGIPSNILHVKIEELANSGFILEDYILQHQIKIVCLDLHWHQQSYDVINTARKIKAADPECIIILGGFTASLFAHEIISDHTEIDFIIRGDAEIPLVNLILTLAKGDPKLNDISNLVWRENGQVRENHFNYVADQAIFDDLEFFHLDMILHHEIYDRIHDFENKLMQTPVKEILKGRSYAYYNPGRGCLVDCTYCGGGAKAQCLINQRQGILLKSLPSTLKDLKGLVDFGIENIYMCFDPLPARGYYSDLFSAVKEQNIKFDLHFECWTLPSIEFMDAFADSFSPDSFLIISPDSGSDKIRKLNKGYYYSNAELINTLDYMFKKMIRGRIYFSAGLPRERLADAEETLSLVRQIKERYKGFFKISFMLIELDPGSPMWFDHNNFGINSKRRSFKDLYRTNQHLPSLGYRLDTFPSKELSRFYWKVKEEIGEGRI